MLGLFGASERSLRTEFEKMSHEGILCSETEAFRQERGYILYVIMLNQISGSNGRTEQTKYGR